MKLPLDSTLGSAIPDDDEGTTEAPKLETFDRPAERFELGAELGRGGMGRVVAATDVSLARSVAIKQVLSVRPDDLARFEREVRITAQLEHPSIVPIHEAARDAEGKPYYVMRRIEGDPLAKRLPGADLPARLALLPNLLSVIDAAAFAHARNIIHRDIKPANILLGAYGETHLIDWGLARKLDDLDRSGPRQIQDTDLTRAGHIYGTVAYMAPEQARGEPVDMRADVYALGATLFHVLVGTAPFSHLSDAERIAAAETGEDRVPLDKLGDEIAPELIAIVDKAMARDPIARYAHAGELATDLRAFLGGKLVAAHRYTPSQRLARFVRRHRFAVALSMISFVVMVTVIVIAIVNVVQEKDAAERAAESAANREELSLIERASTLARSDPTRAAALLLDLPTTTRHAQRARDTISKVAAYGVMRGASKHDQQITGLAFSPDHKRLASVGDDGRLVVYDVATATSEVILDLGQRLLTVGWIDDRSVLITGEPGGFRLVDLATRIAKPFGEGIVDTWWRIGADRVRYVDKTTRRLLEIPLVGGQPRELARDVGTATGIDTVAIYCTKGSTKGSTHLIDGDRVRELDFAPLTLSQLVISSDKQRVAMASTDGPTTEVIEWNVETAQRTGRWQVGRLMLLAYGPNTPIVIGSEQTVSYLHKDSEVQTRPLAHAPMWSSSIASGRVFVVETGAILVMDQAGLHIQPHEHPKTRVIAGTPDGMLVAVGSMDGSVRWTDLGNTTPRPIRTSPRTKVCTATESQLYLLDGDELLEIDLASGKTRAMDVRGQAREGVICRHVVGHRLVGFTPFGVAIVDLSKGTARTVMGARYPVTDAGRTLFAKNADVYEVGEDQFVETKVFTAPASIEGLAVMGKWLLLVQPGGRVLRVDRTAGTSEVFSAPDLRAYGLLPDGRFWLALGHQIQISEGTEVRTRHTFEKKIVQTTRFDDRFFVGLDNGAVWEVGPDTETERLAVGHRKLRFGNLDLASSFTQWDVTTHYLSSGEQVVREYNRVNEPVFVYSGRTLIVPLPSSVVVYRDLVPDDFVEAHAWLGRATNAQLDRNTNVLRWK